MKITRERIVKTYSLFSEKEMYEENIIQDVIFRIFVPERIDPSPHYSEGLDIEIWHDDITLIKPFEKSLQKVEERLLKDWNMINENHNTNGYIFDYCNRLKKEFNIKD